MVARATTSSSAGRMAKAPGGLQNRDIMFGGKATMESLGSGDRSEAFIGGPGADAIIFGPTDRDAGPDPTPGFGCRRCSWYSRVPAGHPDGECQWSDKVLHGRAEPVTRFRFPDKVPRRCGSIIVTIWVKESSRSTAARRRDRGRRPDGVRLQHSPRFFCRKDSSAQRARSEQSIRVAIAECWSASC